MMPAPHHSLPLNVKEATLNLDIWPHGEKCPGHHRKPVYGYAHGAQPLVFQVSKEHHELFLPVFSHVQRESDWCIRCGINQDDHGLCSALKVGTVEDEIVRMRKGCGDRRRANSEILFCNI